MTLGVGSSFVIPDALYKSFNLFLLDPLWFVGLGADWIVGGIADENCFAGERVGEKVGPSVFGCSNGLDGNGLSFLYDCLFND